MKNLFFIIGLMILLNGCSYSTLTSVNLKTSQVVNVESTYKFGVEGRYNELIQYCNITDGIFVTVELVDQNTRSYIVRTRRNTGEILAEKTIETKKFMPYVNPKMTHAVLIDYFDPQKIYLLDFETQRISELYTFAQGNTTKPESSQDDSDDEFVIEMTSADTFIIYSKNNNNKVERAEAQWLDDENVLIMYETANNFFSNTSRLAARGILNVKTKIYTALSESQKGMRIYAISPDYQNLVWLEGDHGFQIFSVKDLNKTELSLPYDYSEVIALNFFENKLYITTMQGVDIIDCTTKKIEKKINTLKLEQLPVDYISLTVSDNSVMLIYDSESTSIRSCVITDFSGKNIFSADGIYQGFYSEEGNIAVLSR